MIILGIAPGLGALAYSVLEANGHRELLPLDSDVLHAGRRLDAATAWEIAKRCRAHHLLLDVILRRHPPAILALGPRLDRREPDEHVAAVRLLIHALGTGLNVPLYDYAERSDLLEALGANGRGLSGLVRAQLGDGISSKDRRIVLASGAALAAVREFRNGHGH